MYISLITHKCTWSVRLDSYIRIRTYICTVTLIRTYMHTYNHGSVEMQMEARMLADKLCVYIYTHTQMYMMSETWLIHTCIHTTMAVSKCKWRPGCGLINSTKSLGKRCACMCVCAHVCVLYIHVYISTFVCMCVYDVCAVPLPTHIHT